MVLKREPLWHAAAGTLYRGAIETYKLMLASGWARSRLAFRAMDAAGEPLPWLSYPAIAWLAATVRGDWTVAEYGSGQSTIWFSKRCKVCSMESDAQWANWVECMCGVSVSVSTDKRVYPVFARSTDDLVIIDGCPPEWRYDCARHCASVKPKRVILDNADSHAEAKAILSAAYRHTIPMVGLAPGCPVQETCLFLEAV